MKLKLTIYASLLASIALFSSCKKNDVINTITGSGDLKKGQCTLSFNTDKDYNGTTSMSVPASVTTTVVFQTSGNKDVISMQAIKYEGTKIATNSLSIYVPTGYNTNSGSLTGNFDGDSDIDAVMMISYTNAGSSTPAYAAESGTITITKLTTSEIEGTFSAHAINESENTNINLSNGKFAAKFN